MMNQKSKKLLSNTFLFFLGSVGSKFIQFFLVPLYTYALTRREYGTVDLFTTTINFLIPIFSIQLSDALLRFGLDKSKNTDDVISSTFKIMSVTTIISLFIIPVLSLNDSLKFFSLYFVAILNLRIYRDLFSIILKIKDRNKLYAIDSILYTVIMLITSFLFLMVFNMGIEGYFISYIIANLFSIMFIVIFSKVSLKVIFRKKDKELIKQIIRFSMPLIINSISYWLITASDKYMINWIMDEESVGLYAVATKVPTIIATLTSVFNQAWLISSINEVEENNKESKFYSTTLKYFYSISFILASGMIFIIKPFMKIYVSGEFYEAWRYTTFLIISVVYSGIAAFLCSIYYALKKNNYVTITTIAGALLNILINIVLIKHCGIIGAAIATLISWVVVVVLRFHGLRKSIEIKLDQKRFLASALLLILQAIFIVLFDGFLVYLINGIAVFCVTLINKDVVYSILKAMSKKIRKEVKR